jgi:hypothetical protein
MATIDCVTLSIRIGREFLRVVKKMFLPKKITKITNAQQSQMLQIRQWNPVPVFSLLPDKQSKHYKRDGYTLDNAQSTTRSSCVCCRHLAVGSSKLQRSRTAHAIYFPSANITKYSLETERESAGAARHSPALLAAHTTHLDAYLLIQFCFVLF